MQFESDRSSPFNVRSWVFQNNEVFIRFRTDGSGGGGGYVIGFSSGEASHRK